MVDQSWLTTIEKSWPTTVIKNGGQKLANLNCRKVVGKFWPVAMLTNGGRRFTNRGRWKIVVERRLAMIIENVAVDKNCFHKNVLRKLDWR